MQAPRFWQDGGWPATLLAPFGAGYAALGRLRWALNPPRRVPVPVICVGNATVGGVGKTPIVLDLIARLQRRHLAVHALCRGHGGRSKGPVRVEPSCHDAAAVGDEALLLAASAPTFAARDRLRGARAAFDEGARVIVLDDGLQYPRLAKDLSLLVVDGHTGLGNGRIVPAGPLREPFARALERSDAVVVVGDGNAPGLPADLAGRPLLRCRLEPTAASIARLRGRRVYAFCGIGRPAKFFETAAAIGAEVVATRAFPDHHPFSRDELARVFEAARDRAALPLTTTKDAARLPAACQAQVAILEVAVTWQNPAPLEALLDDVLTRRQPPPA